jgi:hypothetical protein
VAFLEHFDLSFHLAGWRESDCPSGLRLKGYPRQFTLKIKLANHVNTASHNLMCA